MRAEGPPLELLLRRLSDCPPEFLETCSTKDGGSQLAAIIADHYRRFGPEYLNQERLEWLDKLYLKPSDRPTAVRYWGVLSVATWLIHDSTFLSRPDLIESGWKWLSGESLRLLSEIIRPENLLTDPDRREELVRVCLEAHSLFPFGESLAQSRDRLNTLDSVERKRILQATAEAERRAREVREAMARKQALESASRYGE